MGLAGKNREFEGKNGGLEAKMEDLNASGLSLESIREVSRKIRGFKIYPGGLKSIRESF